MKPPLNEAIVAKGYNWRQNMMIIYTIDSTSFRYKSAENHDIDMQFFFNESHDNAVLDFAHQLL